jgi:SRSO17 transposase
VPDEIVFRTKPQIALAQIEAALLTGAAHGTVLADAAYGNDADFRDRITGWKLSYVVGIQSSTTVWPDSSHCRPSLMAAWDGHPRS